MDCQHKSLEKFVDFDQCSRLIDAIGDKFSPTDTDHEKSTAESEQLVESFRKIIDHYLEQPELLEPYLPELIQKLTSSLEGLNYQNVKYHVIFKYLYQLIKVNGFKNIARKFPHEADKLPYLVELLSHEDPSYIKILMNWQTRYVLTVWLSIVILAPFDFAKFDSASNEQGTADKTYAVLKRSLNIHDSCQHATSFCLAKYFSRPDVIKSDLHLSEFIETTLDQISNIKPGSTNVTNDPELIGHMRTLSYMFRFLPRAEMKERCKSILDVLLKLDINAINREFLNYLTVKLLQRAGMTLLPKRVASWRYKRGARILGQVPSNYQDNKQSLGPSTEQTAEENLPVDTDEEADSAEYIEKILSSLFVAAQNGQTRVRWSAAKGIARIASRLSRDLASDVIDMVLENFFGETSNEFAWHGGCLTLAEMSRNGLILEEKLARVIELVGKAIIYDKIKGSFAVGSHIREGACYVIWAMARTYEDHLIAPYSQAILTNLLCTMLFDRELQCRRAASATFQELVGRKGTSNEENIAILTQVDYQNVGQRATTYVQLASQVASYGNKYSEPFALHLLSKKIGHWDQQIRRLASDSLAALMLHVDQIFIESTILPELVDMSSQIIDANLKHGALLGLAKVIRALVPLQYTFGQEIVDFVGSLVKRCEKQLKSKLQAPNFMEAIGQMILSAEIASFNYDEESDTLKDWESIAFTILSNDNANLRDLGSDAIVALYRTYYSSNKARRDYILSSMNKSLNSPSESVRCGSLTTLSKLGPLVGTRPGGAVIKVEADTPNIIFISLVNYIGMKTREHNGVVFAQAKAEACDALLNFCRGLDKAELIISSNYISAGFEALIEKTEDYTVDKRGDIGVVVRKAAIKALQGLTLHLLAIGLTSAIPPTRLRLILARTLQQAVSYHNSTREAAAVAFYKIVEASGSELKIPHKTEILAIFEKFSVNDEFNWRDDSTPIFVNLLDKPEYGADIWAGLLPSVGQASDLCALQFRSALSSYLTSVCEDTDTYESVLESLLYALDHKDFLDKGLLVIDYLLIQGLLSESSSEFQVRLASYCCKLHGDPKRLILVGVVVCSMLQFDSPIQSKCIDCLLKLLDNSNQRVRSSTAMQFHEAIMTYQPNIDEQLEKRVQEKLKPYIE